MVYKSGQIFLPFCHNPRVWRTDRRTDGQTEISSPYRGCITCSAVKTRWRRDDVGEFTRHANFGFNRYSGCLFWLSCPSYLCFRSYAQVEPLNRFSRFIAPTTCFRAIMVLLRVRTMTDHIRLKYTPKTLHKWAWIGNFKLKRQNVKITTKKNRNL